MRHADGEVNKYILERKTVLKGNLRNLTVPPPYRTDDLVAKDVENGIGEEIFLDKIQQWQRDDNSAV